MKRRGRAKRLLSLVLALIMVFSLIPGNRFVMEVSAEESETSISAMTETQAAPETETGDAPQWKEETAAVEVEPEETGGQVLEDTKELTENGDETKRISSWGWIDEQEVLDSENGVLALPGASEEQPALFEMVVSLLPKEIQALVGESQETVVLGEWSCETYPGDGAFSGSYVFTAALPEGYVLAEAAEPLTITVELGGAALLDLEDHYDENGFCTGYKLDDSGNWVKDSCTEDGCVGYQPAVQNSAGQYEIGNAGQLYWFAGLINGTLAGVSQDTSANAVLTADITVNEDVVVNGALNTGKTFRVWNPIGPCNQKTIDIYFEGIFDGQGHTVSGLYFNDAAGMYVGMFGQSRGTLQNITVAGSYFSAGKCLGGLVGYSENGTITNCSSLSNMIEGTNQYVGGIVGQFYSSLKQVKLTDCCNSSAVTSSYNSNTWVGGIAGFVCANSAGTILVENCSNSGPITHNGNQLAMLGGIAGGCANKNKTVGHDTIQILNCTNSGMISAYGYAGGIVGENGNFANDWVGGTVRYCSNSGTVTGNQSIGGILGKFYHGELSDCENSGDIDGAGSRVGGIIGQASTRGATLGLKNSSAVISNCSNSGSVQSDTYMVGGIAGDADWALSFINCENSGAITGNRTKWYGSDSYGGVGGIVGYCYYSGTGDQAGIISCHNTGAISGYNMVGGIAGYCVDSSDDMLFAFEKNFNTGSITGTRQVGGLVGYDSSMRVQNCYNTGAVDGAAREEFTGKLQYIGGLVGYYSVGYYSTLTTGSCYNAGTITVETGALNVGGAVGYVQNRVSFEHYYYLDTCVETSNTYGTALTAEEMTSDTDWKTNYVNFDSATPIWTKDNNTSAKWYLPKLDDYSPYLKSQSYVGVTGVNLEPETLTLLVGDMYTLEAKVEPEDASEQGLVWTSDDPSVAAVDAEGKVTATAPGTAVITVTTVEGGYTASCTVTVTSHTHQWEYVSRDNMIQAYCTAEEECAYHGEENALMLTLTAEDMEYSGNACTAQAANGISEVTGVQAGEISYYKVDAEGAVSGGTEVSEAVNAGYYYASVTLGEKTAAAAFTIRKYDIAERLTVFVDTGDGLVYNGSAQEPEITVLNEQGNAVAADQYTAVYANNTNATTEAVVTVGFNDSENYTGKVSKNFIIAPKPIIVTANDKTKTYGEDEREFTYTAEGLIRGETLTGIILEREPGEAAGTYTINVSQTEGSNPNYNITFKEGTLTIGQIEAELSWENTSLTYNGNAQRPTASIINLLPGDSCDVTVTGAQTNAGSEYTATAAALSNPNYKLPETATTVFSIEPKNVTVVITPNGGIYAGTINGATAKLNGIVEKDEVPVTLTYTGTANDGTQVESTDVPKLAGKYTVTASIANANYRLTGTDTADFIVSKADQEAPKVTVYPESVSGRGDGGISGVTSSMEYRREGEALYTAIRESISEITGLSAGTYYVRYAETANYNASSEAEATVLAGNKLKIVVPENQTGYTLTADKEEVDWQEDVTLTYELLKGYTETGNFRVMVNNTDITEEIKENGVYTVSKAEESITVTVQGVADITAPEAVLSVKTVGWKAFINKVTFGLFFKDNIRFSVSAEDEGSGIKTVEYLISEEAFETEELAKAEDTWKSLDWEQGEKTFDIADTGKKYVYIRVTDAAGNVTVVSSDGGIVVYTNSAASTSAVRYVKTTVNDVTAEVRLNGNTVKAVYNGTDMVDRTAYEVDSDGMITFKYTYLNTLAVGEYTLRIVYDPQGETYGEYKDSDGVNINDAPDETTIKLTVEKAIITDVSDTTESVIQPQALLSVQTAVTAGKGYEAEISWDCEDNTYDFNTVYTAVLTLTSDNDHEFAETLNGTTGWLVKNENGVVTLTRTFARTRLEKIESVKAPENVVLMEHKAEAGEVIGILPGTVEVELETNPATELAVEWSCGDYSTEPGAVNIFTWTVPARATDDRYDRNGVGLTGTITVTNPEALPVVITGEDRTVTYDGSVIDLTGLFVIDENAGEASYTVTDGTGEGTQDGSKLTITKAGAFTVTVRTAAQGLYAPGTKTVTLTVNKGTGAASVTMEGWTYGGMANAPVPSSVTNGTGNVTYLYESVDEAGYSSENVPTDAGCYRVTAVFGENDLYNSVTASAVFDIAKAAANLSVSAVAEKTYGDAAFTLEISKDSDGGLSFESSDETVAVVENGEVSIVGAGTAVITVKAAETANYLGGEVSVTITAVKKDAVLTVTKVDYEVTYGDADFSIGEIIREGDSGIVFESNNTKAARVDENGRVSIVGAGEASITLTMAESGNYNKAGTSVTVTVKPRPVTVTADDQSKTYGEDDPELTWTAEGLVNGDTLTGIAVTREDGKNAGSYAITAAQETGVNPNYEILFVNGTLTIERKDINDAYVELGDALIVNGSAQTQNVQSVTVTNSKDEVMDVTYEVTGNAGKEPGAYTMTITGTGNFTGAITRSFVIAPAADTSMATNEDGDVVIGNGTIGLEVQQEPGAPAAAIGTNKEEIIEMLVEAGELTAEELAQAADGAEIKIILKVTDISDTISAESKAQIGKTAGGYSIGRYLNISLYKQITRDGQTREPEQISETSRSIRISLEVPENLLNTDSSITRTFWIIRNYEGQAEFLPTTYDAATNMLTFETDKFSDYAIVYKDTKNNKNPLNTATGTTPRTGDDSRLWLWALMLSVSCIVLAGVGVSVKRKKREQ